MKTLRYELKFVLNENMLFEFLQFVKIIGAFNKYPSRGVKSLYFDTINFESIKDNLSGVSQRQKLRLRWYENKSTHPVLELKKRNGRIGDKKKYIIEALSQKEIENKTSGELTNEDLVMNKWGRIVSAKKHKTAKKEKRLEKYGYFSKKGKFGYVKKGTRKKNRKK